MNTRALSNKENIVKQLLDQIWSQGHLELVKDIISDEYTIHHDAMDPLEGQTLGHQAFNDRVVISRQAFPDLHFEVVSLSETADGTVLVSWFMQGTNDGDIPGLPATHQKINVPGMTIYYVTDSKVTGHWQVFDHLVMFNQLGITNINL